MSNSIYFVQAYDKLVQQLENLHFSYHTKWLGKKVDQHLVLEKEIVNYFSNNLYKLRLYTLIQFLI